MAPRRKIFRAKKKKRRCSNCQAAARFSKKCLQEEKRIRELENAREWTAKSGFLRQKYAW